MNRTLLVVSLIIISVFAWNHWSVPVVAVDTLANYPLDFSAPVSASRAPLQRSLGPNPRTYKYKDYVIQPLATLQLEGRVLGTERYNIDRESDLSPIDFALGWGSMADEQILNEIDISQSGRFYFWRTDRLPIPVRAIETHSANMHLIAANDTAKAAMMDVEEGQTIRAHGYLVRVLGDDGWTWQSSMTRIDTGFNACEVFLIERLDVVSP